MQKTILIASLVALVAACAHEEIAQTAEKDWEHGLDADLATQIAPLGPIDSDQGAYNLIRRREKEHSLGSRLTSLDGYISSWSSRASCQLEGPTRRPRRARHRCKGRNCRRARDDYMISFSIRM